MPEDSSSGTLVRIPCRRLRGIRDLRLDRAAVAQNGRRKRLDSRIGKPQGNDGDLGDTECAEQERRPYIEHVMLSD